MREVVLTEMEIDGQFYFASFGRDISLESKRAEGQIINEKNLSDSVINLAGYFLFVR